MITLEPVIEILDAKGFTAWPVSIQSASNFLVLSGELTSADVGTAMAVIAVYNSRRIMSSGERDEDLNASEFIRRIVQADGLTAPGGLSARDTAAGLIVNPSCCCGLEGWREWNTIAPLQSPWLGHSPTPWVEHLGHTIRVWPDGGDEAAPPVGASPIEIPADELQSLIASAHTRLQDFLDLIEPWALPLAGEAAGELASVLATHFRVSWPAADAQRSG